ncbi:hypothetical protein LTR84_004444 [Exophiala bonariae]|uniref:Uncharacterized protein n=1 Tax=Exophiala bonariae TaxID=1690606 RepID=A0AAV9N4L9_9EURO|nr:hypothetical protein LTR84_004444 [Exophiala bonariae]
MSRPGLQHRPSSIAAANKTIILVTGGNAGIGYEIVKSLAQSTAGNCQILLGCRETSKGEEAASSLGAPVNVNPIQLDIEDDTSIDRAFLAIQQVFGKLDVLINNAGTAAQYLSKDATLRQKFDHTFSVNVTSQAVLTDRLKPLLEKAKLPKVIFVSSTLASLTETLTWKPEQVYSGYWYNSSKSALNNLAVYYATTNPGWKVNAVCPGHRATGLNGLPMSDEMDPKHGAVRVVELVAEGPDGVSGTFSRKEGRIPW